MRQHVWVFVVALAISGVASGAHASTITVTSTINLGSVGPVSSNTAFLTPTLTTPVSVAVGDTVDYTVTFANNLALQMNDGSEFLLAALGGPASATNFTIANVQFDFLGFTGTAGTSSSLSIASLSGGQAHLGPIFSGFLGVGQSITFAGYHTTFDVAALTNDPQTYRTNFLVAQSNGLAVVPTVPEPASLLLLGTGFIGGAVRRYRRRNG